MDLSNLSSGIYFVKAITNNGIKVVRFIKQWE
jgi:hypothetical protein